VKEFIREVENTANKKFQNLLPLPVLEKRVKDSIKTGAEKKAPDRCFLYDSAGLNKVPLLACLRISRVYRTQEFTHIKVKNESLKCSYQSGDKGPLSTQPVSYNCPYILFLFS